MLGNRLRRREKLLETSERLLRHLDITVQYTAATPCALIDEACRVPEFGRLPFLEGWANSTQEDFHSRWQDGVEWALQQGALHEEDAALLMAFGEGCGRSDMQGQKAHFDMFVQRIHTSWEASRREADKRARLYISLGLLGGSALALLCV